MWYRSITPRYYPAPTDGPGGEILRAANRSVIRLQHVHFWLHFDGYQRLITQVFLRDDLTTASWRAERQRGRNLRYELELCTRSTALKLIEGAPQCAAPDTAVPTGATGTSPMANNSYLNDIHWVYA